MKLNSKDRNPMKKTGCIAMNKLNILFLAVVMLFVAWGAGNAATGYDPPIYLKSHTYKDYNPDKTGNYYSDGSGGWAPYSLVEHGPGNLSGDSHIFKWDVPDDPDSENTKSDSDSDFTVDINFTDFGPDGTGTYNGTDSFDNNMGTFQITSELDVGTLYFSLKAANGETEGGYNLFVLNDEAYINDLISWSTIDDFFTTDKDDLGGHSLSHIAFWSSSGNNYPGPIPEPATLLLLGVGLMGLGFAFRRKTGDRAE